MANIFFAIHDNTLISDPPLIPISKRSCDPHYELVFISHANYFGHVRRYLGHLPR